ncbi:hypothetical protein D3C85_1520890 [compost metagenome]
MLDVIVGDVADGLLIAADVLGQAREGIAQALGADVLHAALRHAPFGLYPAKGLQGGSAALPALIALRLGHQLHMGTPDGAIAVGDNLGAVPV